MIFKLKNINKVNKSDLQIFKEQVNLQYLSDSEFKRVINYFYKNNIKKHDISIITKYVDREKFDVDSVIKAIEYKNKNKHKKMTYDVEYISLRQNISIDDAKKYIEKFKKDKNTSLDGFIKRHGEKVGLEKYKKFQKTSSISTSKEWFMEKYGASWKDKWKERFENSGRNISYWLKMGFSEEESKTKVLEFQKINSGLFRERYEKLGLSEEEISNIFAEIHKKQTMHGRNRKFLKEKYGNKWLEIYIDNANKYRKAMERKGVWVKLSIIDEFVKYKKLCVFYTNQSIFNHNIKDIDKRSKLFHLDHRFSMKAGFFAEIPPEIIGSYVNLEILPRTINCKKRDKCSITKEELYKLYKENTNENSEN